MGGRARGASCHAVYDDDDDDDLLSCHATFVSTDLTWTHFLSAQNVHRGVWILIARSFSFWSCHFRFLFFFVRPELLNVARLYSHANSYFLLLLMIPQDQDRSFS